MLPEFLYPHMVQDYTVARLRALSHARRERLAGVRTRIAAEAYVRSVRRAVRKCLGPFPARTPLNLVCTGVREHAAYRVEALRFESRPGLVVTANLYLPAGRVMPTGGFPAVLGHCGHSENGKAYPQYQGFSQALARQGFVVLILDPIGQGERMQVPHRSGTLVRNACDEHNMWGKQLGLLGDWFGAWRAWDGIRALDVLLVRPEVDRRRVGVTGISGGGTLAAYLNALDDRITMSAPGCFITSYLHNVENELPTDSEQTPPGMLAAGLDMADLILARAPRPVILLTQEQDYFDPRGTAEAVHEIRRLYRLLGADADAVALFKGRHGHGYYQDTREAMYGFFCRHAGMRVSRREPRLRLAADAELFASPRGEVRRLKVHRLLPSFSAEAAVACAAARPPLRGRTALIRTVRNVLSLPDRDHLAHYRVLRSTGDNARRHFYSTFWSFAVETEPGIRAILQVWDPQDPMTASQPRYAFPRERRLVLYLPHVSSREDVLGDAVPVRPPLLYSLDTRGIGKSMPWIGKCEPFFDGYGADYLYASVGLMLGESYLGRRVHDVLATLDLLQAQGVREVHLIGRGLGAVLAAHAALLHPLVRAVTLKHALLSYHELTRCALNRWPLSVMPHGVLRHYDLPDCYRVLARDKRLRLVQPWNARFEPWPRAALQRHLAALKLPGSLLA